MLFGLLLVLAADDYYGRIEYPLPKSYTASYGNYYAEIPVNDPMMEQDYFHPDTSSPIYENRYGNDPYQKAWERAEEVRQAQRDAFWAE